MIIERDGQVVTTSFDLRDQNLHSYFGGGISRVGGIGTISYRGLWRSQPWVFVAVNAIARGLASMPLKSYEREPDGKDRHRLRSEAHPLPRLLSEPYEGGSTFDLVEQQVNEYLVNGVSRSWIHSTTPGAPADELIPLDPSQLSVLRERTTSGARRGEPIAYVWREFPDSEPHVILPRDMFCTGFTGALSPLAPLATALQIEDAAQRSTKAFYENGARPSGIVATDGDLAAGDAEKIEAMVRDGHVGPDKHFRLAVLGNMPNAKWLPFESNSDDAETIAHRKLNREEVLACYEVPQPKAGVLDRATFSNIDVQDRMWIVHTIRIHAVMYEQRFAAQVLRRDPRLSSAGQAFIEFDFGDILRGTPLQRAEAYAKLLMSGVYTPNGLRALENQPPIIDAWADAIYVPSNLVPIGSPGPLPSQSSTQGAQVQKAVAMLAEALGMPALEPPAGA